MRVALSAVMILVPLMTDRGWHVLQFDDIPAHRVRFAADGLTIQVDRSAGPIVYPLQAPQSITGLNVRGRVTNGLRVTAAQQGRDGFDDFVLRVGLVEAGDRTPGFFERRLAPKWLRMLFDLTPDRGIAAVRFFNLGVSDSQVGARRRHPRSALLHEEIVAVPDAGGRFEFTAAFDPAPVTALWISADGDDTASTFDVTIDTIVLTPAIG